MEEILFWGATGQAKVLHEAIKDTDLRLVALVDNRKLQSNLLGVGVLHGEEELDAWLAKRKSSHGLYYAVAVGGSNGHDRLLLMDILQDRGLIPRSIIHRTAFVADNVLLGEGCQILAQAAVCTDVQLGRGVIINTAASVDHDSVIGDGVHLAPGVHLAGEVIVGAETLIGTGAIVLPRVRIGENVIVGAGAVVINDVLAGSTVVGNPARVLGKK